MSWPIEIPAAKWLPESSRGYSGTASPAKSAASHRNMARWFGTLMAGDEDAILSALQTISGA